MFMQYSYSAKIPFYLAELYEKKVQNDLHFYTAVTTNSNFNIILACIFAFAFKLYS